MMKTSIFFVFVFFLIISCRKSPRDPLNCEYSSNFHNYFTIIHNDDAPSRPFHVFCKKVHVFGLYVYATDQVSDEDLLHAANILAQYLDNDEDSIIDNPLVLEAMIARQAAMVLFKKPNSSKQRMFHNSEDESSKTYVVQDLYGEEIYPDWQKNVPFDATLEEVLHLITHCGFSQVYPSVFGEKKGTKIAEAMDKARGGYYEKVPAKYPIDAWYTYDDQSCEYNCQVTEYFYWSLTSLLGAQDYPGRFDEIGQEWKAYSPTLLQTMDSDVYHILSDTSYVLPTVLPDGSYMR